MPSAALQELRRSLRNALALMRLERGFKDPPPPADANTVEALRGGAAVLMVAAFESYVRGAFEEYLTRLTTRRVSGTLNHLRWNNAYMTFKHAMDGVPGRPRKPRKARLVDMVSAGRIIAADAINPAAFSNTMSNPSSGRVAEMCSHIELQDVFTRIKGDFERRWRAPVATTFVRDKLDEVVGRRHQVAHTGRALNISRSDLAESVRFLRALGDVLDVNLGRHVRKLRSIK